MSLERSFLEKLGIAKEEVESIMAEYGKDVTAHKTALEAKDGEITSKKTEIEGLKTQLGDRDKDIAELKKQAGDKADISEKLTTLQQKYTDDTASLQEQLQKQERSFAIEKFFSGEKFSSDLAKKAAIAEFEGKNFKLDNGEFLGGKDFLDNLKKEQPAAFLEDDNNDGEQEDEEENSMPQFSKKTGKGPNKKEGSFDFAKGFNLVRPLPNNDK